MSSAPQAIVIAGPTASGKTALAIALARRLGTEIISADSMQFYRGMEIGSAAPTAIEQAQAKHHFVGCLSPSEGLPAGVFHSRAREIVARLNARGRIAVVCGGSGLYVNALLDGIIDAPPKQPEIRARLKAEAATHGAPVLMQRLRSIDPDYAATLSSGNDLIRIVRALEVYEVTGEPLSHWHARHRREEQPLAAHCYALAWDRAALYARINLRVEAMIAAGWVEEVRRLLAAGHGPDLLRLKALGYREIIAHLAGEQDLATAIAAAQQHHRRLAKRQLTWFRADPRIHWLPLDESTDMEALSSEIAARTQTTGDREPRRSPNSG